MMPVTMHDISNNTRSHQKAQCQQPRVMLATTHDRSNELYQQHNERHQRQRVMTTMHATSDHTRRKRQYLILSFHINNHRSIHLANDLIDSTNIMHICFNNQIMHVMLKLEISKCYLRLILWTSKIT